MAFDPTARQGEPAKRKRRLPLHIAAPVCLALVIALMLAWSGMATFVPVPTVRVAQVISVSAAGVETLAADPAGRPAPRSTQTVQAPGWIEPEPYATAAAALADGVVQEILVLEGEQVEAGQVVARLVADDARLLLRRAASDLALAEGEYRLAVARLEAASTDWDNPTEIDRMLGTARSTRDELEARLLQLPSMIAEARADLEAKTQEATRLSKAAESGSATELELIIAQSAAEAQRAQVETLERQREILEAQRARAQAELTAAERNAELRVADRLALQGAQASLAVAEARLEAARVERDTAQLRADRMEVRSPMTGLVQRRLKSPGDKVMQGMDNPASAQILLVYDPTRLQVRADVPLADASNVFVGQRCEVFCEVLPDAVFVGEVSRITNEADLQRNTLEIKVRILEPSPMLKPEMLTRVRFIAEAESPAGSLSGATEPDERFRIRSEALRGSGEVLVVRERSGLRGRIESLRVTTVSDSEAANGWTTVSGGLRSTDLVVLGEFSGPEGSLVEIESDRNRTSEGGQS